MTTFIPESQETDASEAVQLVEGKTDEFNWVFFVVIAAFHLGAVAALFCFHWSSLAVFFAAWCWVKMLASASAIIASSRIAASPLQVAGVWNDGVWLPGAAGQSYLLGCCASHAPPVHRPSGRSALTARWQMVVAHGWILRGALHNKSAMVFHYAPDLQRDRFYRWLAVWHWLPVTLSGIVLMACGSAVGGWALGLSWVLWACYCVLQWVSM